MEKFSTCFGELVKKRVADLKIRNLYQSGHSALVYASKFRQLLCDVDWGSKMALVCQFQWGLHEDVIDLLFTLNDATSLLEAIRQVVKCDNQFILKRQGKRAI
jgi:hypothetical protein